MDSTILFPLCDCCCTFRFLTEQSVLTRRTLTWDSSQGFTQYFSSVVADVPTFGLCWTLQGSWLQGRGEFNHPSLSFTVHVGFD